MLAFLLKEEPHAHNWKHEKEVNSELASTRFRKLTHTYTV